jgi:hypothetical protein
MAVDTTVRLPMLVQKAGRRERGRLDYRIDGGHVCVDLPTRTDTVALSPEMACDMAARLVRLALSIQPDLALKIATTKVT